MRVAFVTVGDTGRRTGGYLYNARVIAGLRARGFEVEEIVAGGVSVVEQESAARVLGARLKPSAFDVIVVDALARVSVAPHLDRWRAECPVVAMVHELPSVAGGESVGGAAEDVIRERDYEEPLLRADGLISVSDHGRRLLASRNVSPGRIQIVPPGFDRLDPPATVKASGEEVRALCVAQWIPRKGLLTLVDAWTRRWRPGAVLELVGETDADPEYAARVRDAIAAAPDTSIVVSGAVDDGTLSQAYAAADLFVLPSVYERYGMVYAEALSFGLPVIACGVGPVPDLVGKEAAALVPPADHGSLSEALGFLLEDPALRRRMSRAARRRAEDLPRWEDTVAVFEAVLRGAVRNAPRRMGPI
ncbi:MAG TPA: glycosyltransferase family 4 protein [Rubrobacteraceae bacterium]|nr:glycosyltransferase family 4 protein [Rubrobacteraceae bacterium]